LRGRKKEERDRTEDFNFERTWLEKFLKVLTLVEIFDRLPSLLFRCPGEELIPFVPNYLIS